VSENLLLPLSVSAAASTRGVAPIIMIALRCFQAPNKIKHFPRGAENTPSTREFATPSKTEHGFPHLWVFYEISAAADCCINLFYAPHQSYMCCEQEHGMAWHSSF